MFSIKTYMLILLIALAVTGIVRYGIFITLPQVLIAVFTATAVELFINRIKLKKIIFPSSAFITGMIIALVLVPGVKWFIPLIASFVAITQKQIIRYKGKHIFNPANFGLFFIILIFPTYVTWWGQNSWFLIILAGFFICYKMKRLKLPLFFIASFAFVFSLNNLLSKQPLSNPLLLVNIFFIFVMLIEPKTSPVTQKGTALYALLAALFSFTFFKLIPAYDFSILALMSADVFVPFLNKLK